MSVELTVNDYKKLNHPGKGYRWLQDGEVIIRGDQFWGPGVMEWLPATRVGKEQVEWYLYRRKIVKDEIADPENLEDFSPKDSKPTKKDKRNWFTVGLDLFSPVIDVFSNAGGKYGRCSWIHCKPEDLHERYYSACMRHIEAFTKNEWLDQDSGLPHLAHAAANILILLWHGIRNTNTQKFNDEL